MSEAPPLALGLGDGSIAELLDPVALEAKLERARERRAAAIAAKREAAAAAGTSPVWTGPQAAVSPRLPLLLASLAAAQRWRASLLALPAGPAPTAATSPPMLTPLSGPPLVGPPAAVRAVWTDAPVAPAPMLAPMQAAVDAMQVRLPPPRTAVRPSGMRMNATATVPAGILVDRGSIVRAALPTTQIASEGSTLVRFFPPAPSSAPIDPPRTGSVTPPVAGGGMSAPPGYEVPAGPVVAGPTRPVGQPGHPRLRDPRQAAGTPRLRASPRVPGHDASPSAWRQGRRGPAGQTLVRDSGSLRRRLGRWPARRPSILPRTRPRDRARRPRRWSQRLPWQLRQGQRRQGQRRQGQRRQGRVRERQFGQGWSSGKGSSGKGSSGKGGSEKGGSGKGNSGKGSSSKGSSGKGGRG